MIALPQLPKDPTEFLEKASIRPEQDNWRDDEYLGYIRIERVSRTGFNFDLSAEDIPFLKPSDRLRLLVISSLAKLKVQGNYYLQDSIYRPIYAEFGQEIDIIKGGISPTAYRAYKESNPKLIEDAQEFINQKRKSQARETKTRLIYKRGPWEMGSGLLVKRLAEVIEGLDTSDIDIAPFFIREGEAGYDPAKPNKPNGRGYIYAPPPVADMIVKAAQEKRIVVNGFLKREPTAFVLTVEPFPQK